jgi:hypothetical protein
MTRISKAEPLFFRLLRIAGNGKVHNAVILSGKETLAFCVRGKSIGRAHGDAL